MPRIGGAGSLLPIFPRHKYPRPMHRSGREAVPPLRPSPIKNVAECETGFFILAQVVGRARRNIMVSGGRTGRMLCGGSVAGAKRACGE